MGTACEAGDRSAITVMNKNDAVRQKDIDPQSKMTDREETQDSRSKDTKCNDESKEEQSVSKIKKIEEQTRRNEVGNDKKVTYEEEIDPVELRSKASEISKILGQIVDQ